MQMVHSSLTIQEAAESPLPGKSPEDLNMHIATYLAAGWQLVVALPAYAAGLSGLELALLAAGGLLYTVGAIVFAAQRPNPWPRVAGFHEVFHLLVVVAAALQGVAIASLAI